MLGGVFVVGYHDDGFAAHVERFQYLADHTSGTAVEISAGFVGKYHRRTCRYWPGAAADLRSFHRDGDPRG